MDRIVHQVYPMERHSDGASTGPLSGFLTRPNIVLLGDPGAGKSHTFRAAAAEGGRLLTARAFLTTPVRNKGEVLFIDGLDERRGGRGDRDTVDTLAGKLIEAEPAAVRISCRVADWLGESDITSLKPFFEEHGGIVVLALDALAPDERLTVLIDNGMSPTDAKAMLDEAEERGLAEFLDNPQNLLLLRRAVASGTWPTTRRELFEMATRLMLREENPERARAGGGVYTAEELSLPAGAVLAGRLISDIEAISLSDQEGTEAIPSYRTVPFFDAARTLAALGRRVFTAGPAAESVDYAHRTTAEYLGALWLAEAVRRGLPIGRVVALLGVDGHPAPELRGLHAWLAVALPEHAERLIDADPYGVLTYGDAASLTRGLCARLVRALGQLSRTDPWFRAGNYGAPAISALARADMADEFRAVLRSSDAGFGVRGIVVEALALGTPIPELRDDLSRILETENLPFAERTFALRALLRLGDDGKASVLNACLNVLGTDLPALRLLKEAIERLYGDPFGPEDVAHLIEDVFNCADEVEVGVLWNLPATLPLADLPAILDLIQMLTGEAERRNVWEVASFYDRALVRVLESPDAIDPARLLAWLKKRRSFGPSYSRMNGDQVKEALCVHPERLDGLLTHFLETFVPGEYRWLELSRFQEAVLFAIDQDGLIEGALSAMAMEAAGSPRELFFYEAAVRMSCGRPNEQAAFEHIYGLANGRPDLEAVRACSVYFEIPAGYLANVGAAGPPTERPDPDRLRRNFASEAAAIANGGHINWLTWVARVYLGLFNDVDQSTAPEARFGPMLGDDLAAMALDGLVAALDRTDAPALQDIIRLAVQRQYTNSWHVFIAGLCERFRRTGTLEGISADLLRAMLAFDLTSPIATRDDGVTTWSQHPWKEYLLHERPELVREAYEAVARAMLPVADHHIDGLRELLTDEALEPFREDVVVSLIDEFPNANSVRLRDLLGTALVIPSAHTVLLTIADRVLTGVVVTDQPQHDLWLITAWLLSPDRYDIALRDAVLARREIIFALRDFTGHSRWGAPPSVTLSIEQIEFLIPLAGGVYPPTGWPVGGAWGDENDWDATEYIRRLINDLSAYATRTATEALSRLATDDGLTAYRPEIQHALANQRARRRDVEYDRPDWSKTLRSLDNKQPATVADLHAVLVDHLHDLRERIRTENTDIYRMFWNIDGHGRLLEPRPEEACRDDLITLLRPRLAPLGISLEPEGHMAGDRRADISAGMPGRKILCEIKRDYHADVWTAPDDQLERFYAHDPEAHGFGVYLVFWFGDERPHPIPLPPRGDARPTSSVGMEEMLRRRVPAERAARTAIVVVDVTRPD